MKKIFTFLVAIFMIVGFANAQIEYATNPNPADQSHGINPENVTLSWEFNENATEWRLVFGSTIYLDETHPDTQITEWSDEMINEYEITNLYNNTSYFWRIDQRNETDTLTGVVWGFTTHLNNPINLEVNQTQLFEGQSVELTWTQVVDRTFRRYFIYRNGEQIGSTEMHNINANTFVDEDLAYNQVGYEYYVTASYDEGESEPSNIVTVQVSGVTELNGYVYELDGETGIANATVTMVGVDEFGEDQEYTFTTDSLGHYTGEVNAGEYNGSATCEGYEDGEPVVGNPVTVTYPDMFDVNYTLVEELHAPCEVTAELMTQDTNFVQVFWDMCGYGDGVHHYKIYRTDCENDGPYTEENTLLLADSYEIVSTYVDVNWPLVEVGNYKWGVAAVYEGREFYEPFESEITWSNCIEKTYVDPCPQAAPIHLVNLPNDTHVYITWDQAFEVIEYRVYRNDELVSQIAYDPEAQSYEFVDEPGYGEWTYVVTVVNLDSECEEVASYDFDNPENEFVVAEVTCEGVTELYAGVDNEFDYVNLVWNPVDAEQFIIERSEDGENFEEIAVVEGTSTGWTDETAEMGDYYYRIIVEHENCVSEPSPIAQAYVTNTSENVAKTVYPNPVKDVLTIELQGNKSIYVYNAVGQLVYSNTTTDEVVKINMEDYVSGIYFLKVNDNTYKIVK